MARATRPSQTVLLGDAIIFQLPGWSTGYPAYYYGALPDYIGRPHAVNKTNALWVDGHATTQKYLDLVSGGTTPGEPNDLWTLIR